MSYLDGSVERSLLSARDPMLTDRPDVTAEHTPLSSEQRARLVKGGKSLNRSWILLTLKTTRRGGSQGRRSMASASSSREFTPSFR